MTRLFLLIILCFPLCAFAQYERIITYPNGSTEYIVNFENDVVERTICLSPTGDTIFSWDTKKATFTDHPITGIYLTSNEYNDFRQQLLARHHLSSADTSSAILSLTPPSPGISEWKMMHDHFFKKCPDYTLVIREGDFTIVTKYQAGVQTGTFKKYYKGFLVVNGQYKNGARFGFWSYNPYPYYPYSDIELVNIAGRDFSMLYSVLPALVLILLLFIIGRFSIKKDIYHVYFYILFVMAVIALYYRLSLQYDRQNIWIKEIIPSIWFTLWHAMILLSVINLFFSRRTKPPVFVNMICLLLGLSFSIFIIFFKHLSF